MVDKKARQKVEKILKAINFQFTTEFLLDCYQNKKLHNKEFRDEIENLILLLKDDLEKCIEWDNLDEN